MLKTWKSKIFRLSLSLAALAALAVMLGADRKWA